MAGSNTFGGTIKLEGEKAYRSAISQINSELKVLASELSKVSSSFGKNNTSVEHLTSRNKVLTSEIEKQKAKITTLKSAVEASAEKYGEHDKRTNNWKTSLNKAEAELNQMEKELKDNKDAMEKGEKETENNSKSLKEFGNSADTAGQKTLKMGDIIKANLISDAIKSGLSSLVSGIKSVANAISDVILKPGFDRAMNIEQAQFKLKGLGHDAESVDAIMKNALASVKGTAYGLDEAGTVAASAVAAGIQPGEDLEKTLKLVADASAIAGTDMDEMGKYL